MLQIKQLQKMYVLLMLICVYSFLLVTNATPQIKLVKFSFSWFAAKRIQKKFMTSQFVVGGGGGIGV